MLEPQGLKPNLFCSIYVVAKATTHKDFEVLTQTLKLVLLYDLTVGFHLTA
ncbi:MAG TPA: hypothetical protein VG272_11725 [Candidatus Acidoferrales bacterium]|jgi:hypothetical protein|nr:hypothetical protein [Candidatus Acidoferrales bacterium]